MRPILKHFVEKSDRWSIGIYTGEFPYRLVPVRGVKNPVLTAKSVTDRKADFVADPFMIKEGDIWYMFFEVFDSKDKKGVIGLAISHNGIDWIYKRTVIAEPFHMSYPYVFKWKNEFYIIPETHEAKSIRLYRATSFPDKWEFLSELLTGYDFIDSSIFNYQDRWWLFTCPTIKNDALLLYYANDLSGPWFEHPDNPIINANPRMAKCGGRILAWDNKVIRYAQNARPVYGSSLNIVEITKLTTTDYEEKECFGNPVLSASGKGWNKDGMHHIDPHQIEKGKWLACVDGNRRRIVFHGYNAKKK